MMNKSSICCICLLGVDLRGKEENIPDFFHNDLKYVELCGCICSINVIELASNLLRNANLLKQITFSSREKFYEDFGRDRRLMTMIVVGLNGNLFTRSLK